MKVKKSYRSTHDFLVGNCLVLPFASLFKIGTSFNKRVEVAFNEMLYLLYILYDNIYLFFVKYYYLTAYRVVQR